MSKQTRHEKSTRGKSSSSREPIMEDKVREFGVFNNETHQLHFNSLSRRPIYSGSVIDWSFLANHGLDRSFFESINTDNFSGPQRVNLFQINELVYRELVREFFASIEFDVTSCRAVTVKDKPLLMAFWPTIGDGEFVVGAQVSRSEGVVCNTPYWLARYLKGVGEWDLICGGTCVQEETLDYYRGLLWSSMDGACYWPATRQVRKDDEVEEAAEEGVGGSSDVYRNMSRGDWQVHQGQWIDQMDGRWGQMETWMTSTWMAFGGNTRDLGSFGEEMDKITTLHQI
ncbi:hypothetical protein Tco_1214399 [Tanacetum coccineum]